VLAREQGLQQVDHVLVSNATANHPAGHNVFVVQGDPANPAHLRAMMPTAVAAQTPVESRLHEGVDLRVDETLPWARTLDLHARVHLPKHLAQLRALRPQFHPHRG
ncbi:hypothetical protein E1258_29660, partial [Micromonospora sp. KC207]|uniref:XVIPCD domain-containing protein n=1 Tax=Micromonospora sp. KC207 TaxID=2530377 RepID=UPI0010D37E96